MIIFKSIGDVLLSILNMFSFILIPLGIMLVLFILILIFFFIYYCFIKKIKPKKMDIPRQKEPNFFKKILYLLPRQLVLDYLDKDPFDFNEYGIHMVCGEQGSGKTITVVYLLLKWKYRYPKMQIYTNMCYQFEDGPLDHWKEMIERNNGRYGIVNVVDEIQTWFSSAESKDLPPEVLGEISQQRKQRKTIIGTAQVFGKIAKPLREQTHFVYRPITLFGCLTIVKKTRAKFYDAETDTFKKSTGMFFFVHTKELREAYDTFKRINRYTTTKFVPSIYSGTQPPMAEGPE